MAIGESVDSNKGTFLLNNGQTASGAIATVSLSAGALTESWNSSTDPEKLYAIATALSPCLSKSIYKITRNVTMDISDE